MGDAGTGGGGGSPGRQLTALVAERARREGPLPFEEVVALALYHPTLGFFTGGGGAGRRADFLTSPEVGPLFGAVVARALDTWWRELGQPDPFLVVEAGAGRGALAISVRAAAPACLPALRYVLVERSPALRERQADHLPLLAPGAPGTGFASVADLGEALPEGATAVVLANELLDNLPFGLLERSGGAWAEVRVGAEPTGDALQEVLAPAPAEVAAWAAERAPAAGEGARIPRQVAAAAWVADALARLGRGRLVVLDYGATTAELAEQPWPTWVRTYRGHQRGAHPLERLGLQDVTVDVCVDQVAAGTSPPPRVQTQAELLRAHGIDELVEEGRRRWAEGAAAADLAALRARSRVREAEALLDPAGLGGFLALGWHLG